MASTEIEKSVNEMPDTLQPCESLRTVDSFFEPDVRNGFFVRFDDTVGDFRSATASEHIADVASFNLIQIAPEPIRIHFETAKNLYAYAWCVYRFYPVAEQHALTCLEFALRERLASGSTQPATGTKSQRGLSALLKEALKRGAISNDRFSWSEEWALQRARERSQLKQIEEMQCTGLVTCEVDHPHVEEVSPEDDEQDWIGTFIETLPKIRNTYAHGSNHLHNGVLRTFKIVSELINQLFTPVG